MGQHFTDALDLMAQPKVDLIVDLTRGYSFAGGRKQQSTVKATPAFDDRVRPAVIGWGALCRAEGLEVLILKGPKDSKTGIAEIVDYAETAMTRRRRKEVRRINEALRDAPRSS
jgi:hypothetical protein